MKKLSKIFAVLAALCTVLSVICVPAAAFSPSEARDSVVFIASVVEMQTSEGKKYYENHGSGFAVGDPKKPVTYIVTNAHVVSNYEARTPAMSVTVYFNAAANKYMEALIYRIDYTKDIAVLKLPEATTERKALVLCKSKNVDIDDNFAALGYPSIGMSDRDYHTLDQSDISVTKGGISKETFNNDMVGLYEIDIDISGGNSGGPLVNSKGQVVGINVEVHTNSSVTISDEGIGVSIADKKYALMIDELTKMVSREEIGYVLSTDTNVPVIIIIIAAAVVVIAAVVIIIVYVSKHKGSSASGKGASTGAGKVKGGVIVGEKGVFSGVTFQIGDRLIMGREGSCGVKFPDTTKGVSHIHCEIRKTSSGYEIVDKSSGGTFLGNGQRLVRDVPSAIDSGMYFYLGSAEQLFQIKY